MLSWSGLFGFWLASSSPARFHDSYHRLPWIVTQGPVSARCRLSGASLRSLQHQRLSLPGGPARSTAW